MRLHIVILNLSIGPFMTHIQNHKMEQKKFKLLLQHFREQMQAKRRTGFMEKYRTNQRTDLGKKTKKN